MLRISRSLSPRLNITTQDSLDRWIARVVHTTAIDALRRDLRRRARERRAVSSPAPSTPATRQESAAAVAERIDWIRAQMDSLDAVDRDLLTARYRSPGRPLTHAASDSGLTPGSATGRLSRLMARLRLAGRAWTRDD